MAGYHRRMCCTPVYITPAVEPDSGCVTGSDPCIFDVACYLQKKEIALPLDHIPKST